MSDYSVEPTMPRVAVIPFPPMDGCYLVLSGKVRQKQRYGDKWYSGHEENVQKYEDELRTESHITFTYVQDGVAAEWDGEYGPIQLWFKSTEGYKEGYDESRPHWLWPFAFGSGHWSQMTVDEAGLGRAFNKGEYQYIFSVLKSWVVARLPQSEAA